MAQLLIATLIILLLAPSQYEWVGFALGGYTALFMLNGLLDGVTRYGAHRALIDKTGPWAKRLKELDSTPAMVEAVLWAVIFAWLSVWGHIAAALMMAVSFVCAVRFRHNVGLIRTALRELEEKQ